MTKLVYLLEPYLILLITLAIATPLGCNQSDSSDDPIYASSETVNERVYNKMKEDYLWYDKMPYVDSFTNESPHIFINKLIYQEVDKWSYSITSEMFENFFDYTQTGDIGIGHGIIIDDNSTKIRVVYQNTKLHDAGVRRGWKIDRVNGETATDENAQQLLDENNVNDISFIDNNNHIVSMKVEKENIIITTVIYSDIFVLSNNIKVGYLVFNDFIDTAYDELDNEIDYFIKGDIDELIVDTRYSKGIHIDVSSYFASLLTEKVSPFDIFGYFTYNDNNIDRNFTKNFKDVPQRLNLDRIIFITSRHTGIAGELLINGLAPYIDVILVGNRTSGTPFFMTYTMSSDTNFAYSFVVGYAENAIGFGEYLDGLNYNLINAEDDVTRCFGDRDEASLAKALNFIESGKVD